MGLALPKHSQGQKLTKRLKPDKLEAKREELRQERIAKAKIRELDGQASASPYHWEWRRLATDKRGIINGRYANVLSVHRIQYASH